MVETPSRDRLHMWADSPWRMVTLECRPNTYLNGLPEWFGEARHDLGGWEIRIVAGPCPDVETVSQFLIERLDLAGITVP